MRKVIQLAVSVVPWTDEGDHGERREKFEETMYALADDGTLWYSLGNSPTILRGWALLSPIPQGDVTEQVERLRELAR